LPSIIITVIALGILYRLNPPVGKLKLPVIVYIVVIATLGISAFGRLEALSTFSAIMGTTGAVLFIISDGVLSWNKFKQHFPAAQAIILATYYLGQGMIAFSIL